MVLYFLQQACFEFWLIIVKSCGEQCSLLPHIMLQTSKIFRGWVFCSFTNTKFILAEIFQNVEILHFLKDHLDRVARYSSNYVDWGRKRGVQDQPRRNLGLLDMWGFVFSEYYLTWGRVGLGLYWVLWQVRGGDPISFWLFGRERYRAGCITLGGLLVETLPLLTGIPNSCGGSLTGVSEWGDQCNKSKSWFGSDSNQTNFFWGSSYWRTHF